MQNTHSVKRAAAFIREHAPQVDRRWKGCYHFSAPAGWINDPNGLCFFQNKYHLFYQHHPYNANWGPMYWGHAVSVDLITWEHLAPALAPDTGADCAGCFSGTAFEHGSRLFLMYTGVSPDAAGSGIQQQCLAWSDDGVTFTKAGGNPVIPAALLPEGFSPADFRDPKLWEADGCFYCLAAAADAGGVGRLLLFSSSTLMSGWRFETDYVTGPDCFGGMKECPDRFSLDGAELLFFSVIRSPADEYCLPFSHGSVWAAGDECGGRFHTAAFTLLDSGFDFYAPQTLRAPDGRRIMIAWMHAWESENVTAAHGWAGSMCLPRELVFTGGRLLQKPAREIEAYLEPLEAFADLRMAGGAVLTLKGAPCMEITLEAATGEDGGFVLVFFAAAGGGLRLEYNAATGVFTIGRTGPGAFPRDTRVIPRPAGGNAGEVTLRAFIDRCSLEVFVDAGEMVFTSLVFPEETGCGLTLTSAGDITIKKLVSHTVRHK